MPIPEIKPEKAESGDDVGKIILRTAFELFCPISNAHVQTSPRQYFDRIMVMTDLALLTTEIGLATKGNGNFAIGLFTLQHLGAYLLYEHNSGNSQHHSS